jgi:hypothetical protein
MRLLQATSERTKKKERRTVCVGAGLNDFWVGMWATKDEPKELKVFELKYVFPPKYCPTCGQNVAERHLQVLATNEEEALMMRRYLLCEGFEA